MPLRNELINAPTGQGILLRLIVARVEQAKSILKTLWLSILVILKVAHMATIFFCVVKWLVSR